MKNKLIITLVIFCLLSIFIPTTISQPGVDKYQSNDFLLTPTSSLQYGQTLNIEVNHSLNLTSPHYYLYYPQYTGTLGGPYTLQWIKYEINSYVPHISTGEYIFSNVNLNHSGLWLIADTTPDTTNDTQFASTVFGWFWVNASKSLDIDLCCESAIFGENTPITLSITKNGNHFQCYVDVRNTLGSSVINGNQLTNTNGEYTFNITPSKFNYVGNYTIYAYSDEDTTKIGYQETPGYYDINYGKSISTSNYNYTYCGPWDPPEYFAESKTLVIQPNHNLLINATPTTSYAGDNTKYTINITSLSGSLDSTQLTTQLLTSNDTIIWQKTGQKNIEDEIILDPGTYHFYAYNLTHDSLGYNKSITILPYIVSCTPTPLIWLVDTNKTITFSITPSNNGTLKMYNITSNNNIVNSSNYKTIDIINGTGNITKINATDLGTTIFEYCPNTGEYRLAEGNLKVTTATATPNPPIIYVQEPKTVTITVIHPITGLPIPNVDVTLQSNILASIPDKQTTDISGQVHFGILTTATGNIIILINGKYDPTNKFIIESAFKDDLTLSYPTIVKEGQSFTVTITSYGDPILKPVDIKLLGLTYTTSTGTIDITTPNVTSDTTVNIEASSYGYNTYKNQIIITNTPILSIILDKTQFTSEEYITITIADDTGRPIIGAKVTFNGNDYYTQSTGSAALTNPKVAGEYPITVTFDDYKSDSKTITIVLPKRTPGFELVVFIISIVAVILILRKKKQ